jgi:ParB family chromosome partitioning protein
MPTETLKRIGIDLLDRSQYQPRKVMGWKAMQELAESIRNHDVIEPIVVRPKPANRYEIIAGERRWRASQIAGLHDVPCVVRQATDVEAATLTLVENVQRENLRPIEEATGIQRLVDEFGRTHEQLAEELGWSRVRVSQALRLLQLVPQVRHLVDGLDDEDADPLISRSHAEVLAGLEPHQQLDCARNIINYGWTVRDLEIYCRSRFGKAKHQKAKPRPDSDIHSLEEALSETLGARVSISHSTKSEEGKITISYHSLDELDGLLEVLRRERALALKARAG